MNDVGVLTEKIAVSVDGVCFLVMRSFQNTKANFCLLSICNRLHLPRLATMVAMFFMCEGKVSNLIYHLFAILFL